MAHSPKLPAKPSISGGKYRRTTPEGDIPGGVCLPIAPSSPVPVFDENWKNVGLLTGGHERDLTRTAIASDGRYSALSVDCGITRIAVILCPDNAALFWGTQIMLAFSSTIIVRLRRGREGVKARFSFRVSDSARFGRPRFPSVAEAEWLRLYASHFWHIHLTLPGQDSDKGRRFKSHRTAFVELIRV